MARKRGRAIRGLGCQFWCQKAHTATVLLAASRGLVITGLVVGSIGRRSASTRCRYENLVMEWELPWSRAILARRKIGTAAYSGLAILLR